MSHFEGKLAPLKFLFGNLRSLRLHSLNKRKFAFLTVSSVSCPKLVHLTCNKLCPSFLSPAVPYLAPPSDNQPPFALQSPTHTTLRILHSMRLIAKLI